MITEKSKLYFRSDEAFVAYSSPGNTEYTLLCENDRGFSKRLKGEFDQYIIAPFWSKRGDEICSISADQEYHNIPFELRLHDITHHRSTSFEAYSELFSKAKKAISQTQLKKVILSRIMVQDFDHCPEELFNQLRESYPSAYVFIYNLPGYGCWVGATPELLIRQLESSMFQTMALAGTQVYNGSATTDVSWGEKEIQEQRYLQTFLIEKFKEENVDYIDSGSRTIRAGNVYHISSEYTLESDRSLLSLGQIMHPGPAISGYPQSEALTFIDKNEEHEREHYCGYLGRINSVTDNELFINLRSLKLSANQLSIYLGGGITDESKLEAEWQETEHKSKTLTSAIEALAVLNKA